jgi:hypothetical protein
MGFSTRAIAAVPVFLGLSVYDYLISPTGKGDLNVLLGGNVYFRGTFAGAS